MHAGHAAFACTDGDGFAQREPADSDLYAGAERNLDAHASQSDVFAGADADLSDQQR